MWAMIVKEFRQVRRDRRTLAMMIVLPVLLLVVLGYAASFDVKSITVAASGPQAGAVAASLRTPFDVTLTAADRGASWARDQLRDGKAEVAIVTGGTRPHVLIDGSQLFSAKAALAALAEMQQGAEAKRDGRTTEWHSEYRDADRQHDRQVYGRHQEVRHYLAEEDVPGLQRHHGELLERA